MKSVLVLIALLFLPTFFLSLIESRPIRDVEQTLFMSLDDDDDINSMSLFDETINEHTTDHGHHHPKHPKHPKYPPPPRRAYVNFPSPPDIAAGVIIFWECKNVTLVSGQFSKGFVEGDEKKYSFKIYQNNQEILDLKPEGESLDKIFKINSNGSTDIFLFAVNDTLISTRGIAGGDFVISKPDALIGKDTINVLSC